MQYELCRHIKTNGLQCKAAALAGGIWCYFHHRLHQRHTPFRPTQDLAQPGAIVEVEDAPETPLLWEGFEHDNQEEENEDGEEECSTKE